MKDWGAARDQFSDSKEDVAVEPLRVDRTVKENDRIDLGSRYLYFCFGNQRTYGLFPDLCAGA